MSVSSLPAWEYPTGSEHIFALHSNPETCLGARSSSLRSRDWILDGGATCFVTWDASICTEIRQQITDTEVGGGNVRCTQVGKLIHVTCIGGRTRRTKVDIVIAPTFRINIVPELHFLKHGCSVIKDGSVARVIENHGRGHTIFEAALGTHHHPRLFIAQPARSRGGVGVIFKTSSMSTTQLLSTTTAQRDVAAAAINNCDDTPAPHISHDDNGDPPMDCGAGVIFETSRIPGPPQGVGPQIVETRNLCPQIAENGIYF
jgi:hypothetical protein